MSDLGDHIRDLAASDREDAPPFAATLAAARRRTSSPVRSSPIPALSAVAAGTLLAFAVVPRFAPDGSLQAAIAQAREISAWSEPTSVFLDPLDRTLSDSTPTLTLTSVDLPE